MGTIKQERAIQLYKENYGKSGVSMYDIMRDAGYSHSAAKNPDPSWVSFLGGCEC